MTTQLGNGGITSDDFQSGGTLDSVWDATTHINGGTVALSGQGTSDAVCTISVPSGSSHDIWNGSDGGCQVVQPCNSTEDFLIRIKMQGAVAATNTSRGLVIRNAAGTETLRCDNYSDGTQHIFVGRVIFAGGSSSQANVTPGGITGDLWLEAEYSQAANTFAFRYSTDGSSFTLLAGGVSITPAYVGFFAGNFTTNPAYTATFDWFMEMDSGEVSPEDPTGGATPRRVMVIS